MNPTIEWIFSIAGGALTLLTVYGAVKSSRKLLLSGICYFSILPLVGEGMAYNADKAPAHVMVMFLFLVQFVLALPNTIVYGPDNTAGIKLATKISLGILIINVGGAVFILCLKAVVPVQFGYFHVVIALAVAYLLIKRLSSNGTFWLK